MVIYFVSGLVKRDYGRVVAEPWKRSQVFHFLAVMMASVVALIMNPYGYKLAFYPFDLLFRQQENLASVIEWQSVDFNTVFAKLAMIMLFALVLLLLSNVKWAVRDVAMVCFALWSSLSHLRFLQFAAILLIPVLAPKFRVFSSPYRARIKAWLAILAGAATLVIVVWSFPSSDRLQSRVNATFPHNALRYIKQNQISGKLFNYYDFGGYIEWYAPELKTFADGRTDIFVYNGVFRDYLNVRDVREPFTVLDRYKIDYVLVPPTTPLSYVLSNSTKWKLLYDDSVAQLYQRALSVGHATPGDHSADSGL
jgi:hypothetical protein